MSSYVPFSEREEWRDVTPIAAPADAACAIAYTAQFAETMAYFRAVLLANEHSERSLALTKEVIELNTGNYTAFAFRRAQLLAAPVFDVSSELAWTAALIDESPKNYQLWHHRRAMIEHTGGWRDELAFIVRALRADAKNYHAWSYRQWLVEYYYAEGAHAGELAYARALLDADWRNNSAWNYRHFLVLLVYRQQQQQQQQAQQQQTSTSTMAPGGHTEDIKRVPVDVAVAECALALDYAAKAPNNESAWMYARSFLRRLAGTEDATRLVDRRMLRELLARAPTSVPAWATLIDYLATARAVDAARDRVTLPSELAFPYDDMLTPARSMNARDVALLLSRLDSMRSDYWQQRADALI